MHFQNIFHILIVSLCLYFPASRQYTLWILAVFVLIGLILGIKPTRFVGSFADGEFKVLKKRRWFFGYYSLWIKSLETDIADWAFFSRTDCIHVPCSHINDDVHELEVGYVFEHTTDGVGPAIVLNKFKDDQEDTTT
jgi:hypothetical protein